MNLNKIEFTRGVGRIGFGESQYIFLEGEMNVVHSIFLKFTLPCLEVFTDANPPYQIKYISNLMCRLIKKLTLLKNNEVIKSFDSFSLINNNIDLYDDSSLYKPSTTIPSIICTLPLPFSDIN